MRSGLCGKHIFNVRFFFVNVYFSFANVHFFRLNRCSADMQCPVMQRIVFIQQEIAKERFKVLCRLMNAFFQVVIVCPDQRITKIPRIFGKNIVCYIKAQRVQILDKEYRRCSGVTLAKDMDLPQPGNEKRKVMNNLESFLHEDRCP